MIKRLFRKDKGPRGGASALTTASGTVAVPAAAAAQPVLSALGRLEEVKLEGVLLFLAAVSLGAGRSILYLHKRLFCPQAEELLTKRRDLLERKVQAELLRAKEAAKAHKKKGELRVCGSHRSVANPAVQSWTACHPCPQLR
jgi:hypothetical protein